ncbi:RNA polymerase sigma factor [Micromonospora chersina]|uniref:RNA polymerase sigma factor n=1 Tax=Micromonospora chersina TaxID=47854 RepID=UPI0037987953
MHEDSNEDLLVAVAAGPGALQEFYRRHVAKVMGMAVRRFSNPEDVADFVATVFLEVLRSAGGFDPQRGSAVSWLYGLAGNVATGMYRQQARSADAQLRLSGRALLDADDYARVEERIDAAATLRHVYRAMQQLGDADRRLLELVAVDGLSAREAADVLKITQAAVRVRLLRARHRLRNAMLAASQPSAPISYLMKEESV